MRFAGFVFAAVFFVLGAVFVFGQLSPNPPDTLTVGGSTRHVETVNGFQVPAAAGNVSALVLVDTRITSFWQGYYGNVSGTIVLDDAGNSTLFAWELATPSGEVFAVNTSSVVNWNNVTCVNFTGNASGSAATGLTPGSSVINLSNLAVQFNMNRTVSLQNLSPDAVNNTFNTTFSGNFNVGTRTIVAGDNCPQAFTFVNDAYQVGSFRNVLLHDNRSALIFAAFLENNKDGFQTGGQDLSDFQMLVAEDGTPGKEAASTYYFYVELE